MSRLMSNRRLYVFRWTWVFALGAMVGVVASEVSGQTTNDENDVDTAGLVIEATVGWDGTVDTEGPVPVSLLISNYSERAIEGRLVLTGPDERTEDLGEVFAAPGTTRRFGAIRRLRNWYECKASLVHEGQVLWRRELPMVTGSDFSNGSHFILVVDEGGRKLEFPRSFMAQSAASATPAIAKQQGRPLRCISVKPWQVPEHPGPIIAASAVILPAAANLKDLNRAQWRALSQWTCQGGTLLVHRESSEIINRVLENLPLDGETTEKDGEMLCRSVGLGSIWQYDTPLFSSEGAAAREQIAKRVSMLPNIHIGQFLGGTELSRTQSGRADINRFLIVSFFTLYTLMSGVVAFLLFRLSRRSMAVYAFSVVTGASVLAGILGSVLRASQGDIRVLTVTQPGHGGAVQAGRIEVQSAGARSTHVAVEGTGIDVQHTGPRNRYFDWNWPKKMHPAFTWQPNLLKDEDAYGVRVPLTPWGSAELRAMAFCQDIGSVDVELRFEAAREDDVSDAEPDPKTDMSASMPRGTFHARLANNTPFELQSCWLVIGATHRPTKEGLEAHNAEPHRWGNQLNFVDGFIDIYHKEPLGSLASGASRDDQFDAEFNVARHNWDLRVRFPTESLLPPRLSRFGTCEAWLIAQISKSPNMTIDRSRSDFIPQEQTHFFVQPISRHQMPDAAQLNGRD